MQLCDFFIECALSEQKIEMSRRFVMSLPTYNPYSAFQEISNGDLFITAKSLSQYFQFQGDLYTENECQVLIRHPIQYESFLKLIQPIEVDNYNVTNSKLPLSQEVKLALSRHLSLHIGLLRILQPPLVHFSGTVEQVGEYFKNMLQFVSMNELVQIKRFLDYEESGIIDTRIPFQITQKQGINQNMIQIEKQISPIKKQQKISKPISDMKEKDSGIPSVDSPLIVIVSILKKEIKLSSIRKKLYNNQNFNLLLAFQSIDQGRKGFITMKDYDEYLNQPSGTAQYIFQNIDQFDYNYFKDLLKPKLLNELPQPKSLKTDNNFQYHLKEYCRILQVAPSKIHKTKDLHFELEQLTSQSQVEAYLRQNGYNYTAEEINLLFQKQYLNDTNLKELILQYTIYLPN